MNFNTREPPYALRRRHHCFDYGSYRCQCPIKRGCLSDLEQRGGVITCGVPLLSCHTFFIPSHFAVVLMTKNINLITSYEKTYYPVSGQVREASAHQRSIIPHIPPFSFLCVWQLAKAGQHCTAHPSTSGSLLLSPASITPLAKRCYPRIEIVMSSKWVRVSRTPFGGFRAL
jgi:hypothetical protein